MVPGGLLRHYHSLTFLSAILHKCRHFIAYPLGHPVPKPLRNTFCGWPTHFSLGHSTQMSSLLFGWMLLFPAGLWMVNVIS